MGTFPEKIALQTLSHPFLRLFLRLELPAPHRVN